MVYYRRIFVVSYKQVGGGNIDWAHHAGIANTALDEAYAFDTAIERALQIVDIEVRKSFSELNN